LLRDLAGKCFGNISSAIYFEGFQARVVSIWWFYGVPVGGFWILPEAARKIAQISIVIKFDLIAHLAFVG